MKIDGNISATVQVKAGIGNNELGETVQQWSDLGVLKGFLDNVRGQKNQEFNASIQETSDIFICDYGQLNGMHFTSENARMVINGNVYQILMIDDVSDLHHHLEIYLKFIGIGQTR